MLRLAELDVDTEHQALIFEDQTGLATMLLRAASWLAAGQIEQCIVGGIASHLEPYLLEALLGLSMIKTPAQANGFLPGEGAAFLLVEPYSGQTDTLGTINVTGLDAEPEDRFTGDQPRGEALARVTDAVLRTSGFIPDIIVGDLNGEVWRAADWGYALSRLYAEHDAALDRPVWYPAASFGDTGAAAGLIGVALTLHLFQRVARIERAFLHLASSSGARAALALSAARN
ncbi:MAG: beta-ketoacyl synthase N-terminal-like domain-containing protein [Bacteroidota bacterium]